MLEIEVTGAPPQSSSNNATIVAQSVPASMTSGQRYPIAVTVRNTGTTTWTTSGYALGSQNPENNTIWGANRAHLSAPVAPGEQQTISFYVTAPLAGTYNMQWRMTQEGVQWFGDPASATVRVDPDPGSGSGGGTGDTPGPEIVTYIYTDGLGSPVARTDAAGQLVGAKTRYEPYGRVFAGDTRTIGFTGHVNDTATGLVYMQQRYYDPLAGRFLSIDPVVTDANTGSSFNRYAYAANSPYKYIDPDGRAAITAEICLGFCAGITIGYNVASTEIAIVGNVGAGLGGGIGLDLRPNENGRAGSSSESIGSGVSGNTYAKGGVDVKTPAGSVGLAGKVVAGKDLGTGKTFGGLSPEIGVSKERGAKVSAVAAGGVEGAAYVNVRDAANDIKTAISTAASDFNKNVVQPALKAMEPQIDKQTN